MTRCRAVNQKPLNTVQVEHPSHTGALLSGLNTLRSKGLLLDVTLVAGSEAFQAHRVVLASCSDYFRAMFTDEMRERKQTEISLNGVSAAGLRSLLEYAYTSRLSLNLANVQDVLSAAAHVQVLTVVEACSNYLQAQLDLDNCVDIATIAETYSLYVLRKKVYSFMSAHLQQFSRMSDFQRMTPNQLLHLLSCDYPVDCSESQVVQTVLGWLQHNQAERDKYINKLLTHINWSEVPRSMVDRVCKLLKMGTNTLISNVPSIESQISINQSTPADNLISEVSTSESQVTIDNLTPPGIVNSRGLELAIVKVGGFNIAGITNEITYYLHSVGRWKHLTTIPHVEQCNFGTAVLNNELYVIGGCFNQSLQEDIHPFGFKYNPQQNKWSTIAPMYRERCRFTLNVINQCLYAIGGASETPEEGGVPIGDASPCEMYNSRIDSWLQFPPMPGARAQHASCTLNELIFVAGGLEGDHVLSSCKAYNRLTGQWKDHGSLLTPRADHVCFTYNGSMYVCGGWYEDNLGNRILANTIDRYNLPQQTWEVVTSVPTPRYHAGIAVTGSHLYVIGGFNSDAIFDRATGVIECLDLDNMRWHNQTSYPQDIWEHTCVPLYIPRCRDDMDVLSLTR